MLDDDIVVINYLQEYLFKLIDFVRMFFSSSSDFVRMFSSSSDFSEWFSSSLNNFI